MSTLQHVGSGMCWGRKRGAEVQEKELISASEAARILGCSAQMVRERIKRGIWKFGDYIPKSKSGNEVKDSYCIYRSKLYQHIGKVG